jgi:hypothetical protein
MHHLKKNNQKGKQSGQGGRSLQQVGYKAKKERTETGRSVLNMCRVTSHPDMPGRDEMTWGCTLPPGDGGSLGGQEDGGGEAVSSEEYRQDVPFQVTRETIFILE